jgi:hypothetical protein
MGEQCRDELRVVWKDEERTGGGVTSTSTRLGSICFTDVFVPHTSEEQHVAVSSDFGFRN